MPMGLHGPKIGPMGRSGGREWVGRGGSFAKPDAGIKKAARTAAVSAIDRMMNSII